MFYFCCGMVRSCSTWQYDIVKTILEKKNLGKPYGWLEKENLGDLLKQKENLVVKVHESYDEALETAKKGEIKVIYIYRDLRDVAASFMARHKRNFQWVIDTELLQKAWRNYKRWTSVPGAFIQKYEEVVSDMPAAIFEIASFLGVELTNDEIKDLAERFSIEKQKEVINKLPGSSFSARVIRTTRRRIGNVLHSAIGKEKTIRIARHFGKIGRGHLDNNTLLLSDHINTGEIGSYKKVLSKKDQMKIEEYLKTLLKKNF
jgi:hypothetical protein